MNNKSKAAENERKRRITASKTLEASENELARVKADLTITTRERDNVSAGLSSAQKQATDQTKRVLEAEDQLRIAKDLIEGLNKQLAAAVHDKGVAEYARKEALRAKQEAEFARNEAEAAKEIAEDDGYNMGVAETQATLKAQIPGVCRFYCSQVWEEALKRVRVDASSDLWKAENVFYPTAIREATSSSSVATGDQPEEGVTQSEDLQASGSSSKPLKEGELQDVIVIPQHVDPEAPKEVAEPSVGIQVSSSEEPATLAQPPQAIPLAVVPQSSHADPVQPSPEGTILQGVEADSVPSSQDVTDEKVEK